MDTLESIPGLFKRFKIPSLDYSLIVPKCLWDGSLALADDCLLCDSTTGCWALVREYWMIYRGPGFLSVVWFGSNPSPLSSACCLSFPIFLCVAHRLLTGEGRGWRGWGRSQIIRRRESPVYKSFNTLWLWDCPLQSWGIILTRK